MRSSKSRSRNKSNRQRSIGNIINRVFDSSGPEGKVRGTPQQIIEKYLALARDAQLGNDRVAEQNFLQHAEHYTRMLGEAQREVAREQEERQRSFQQNGQNAGRERPERNDREPEQRYDREAEPRYDEAAPVAEPLTVEDDGPGLVETPETQAEEAPVAPAPAPRRAPKPAAPAPEPAADFGLPEAIDATEAEPEAAAEAASEEGARPRARTRRGPRKPRAPKGEESAEAPTDAAGE